MAQPPPTFQSHQIPLAKLPYGFKRRVVDLAPPDDLPNVRQTCFEFEKISPRSDVYDQLYITDDETVHLWATQKLYIFQTLQFVYWFFRWLFDGLSFCPTWRSVLYVNEIVKKERPICVTDTLVLHCQSIDAFEELIPYVCGPYTRLTIHGGSIRLGQLRRLMKNTVRKVEITAEIELDFDEYDDAVQLILRHVRKTRDNFHLMSTPLLITQVRDAVENDRYRRYAYRNTCNIIHWKMSWIRMVYLLYLTNYLSSNIARFAVFISDTLEISPERSKSSSPARDAYLFVLRFTEIIYVSQLMFCLAFRLTLKSKPN
uniref:F-box domain-containing protein n=1 Tax=Panagrellus redivivus TaxID=6233 RepID=A0A7E4V440_PANRE